MADYILTNKAVEDLAKIWDYPYDLWSENRAEKYYYILLDYRKELAEKPGAGKIYEEINEDILGFKAIHHIIFYEKLKEDRIKIVRILDNRMDLKSRMQE